MVVIFLHYDCRFIHKVCISHSYLPKDINTSFYFYFQEWIVFHITAGVLNWNRGVNVRALLYPILGLNTCAGIQVPQATCSVTEGERRGKMLPPEGAI